MIARFLTDRDSESNYSLNIGEVQTDGTLPIWCEDDQDEMIYTDIYIKVGDIAQLIGVLNARKEQLLNMEE